MPVAARPGRVNLRLLMVVGACAVLAGGGLVVARQIQVHNQTVRAREDGLAAVGRADWRGAVRHLGRYLRRAPQDVEILAAFADACRRIRPAGQAECQAAADAHQALFRLRPDDGQAFEQLARLTFGLRDFVELQRFAQLRMARAPGDVRARIWLARAHLGRRAWDAAGEVLTALEADLRGDPTAVAAYSEVCVLLSAAAELNHGVASPEAVRWLDTALAAAPTDAAARVHRARLAALAAGQPGARDRAGPAARAREDLEQFSAGARGDAELRLTAAIAWCDLGETARASAELAGAEALDEAAVSDAFPVTADWIAARFRVAALITMRQEQPPADVAWVDTALAELKTRSERAPVLADAIRVLCRAGRAADAPPLLAELAHSAAVLFATDSADEVSFLQAVIARGLGDDHGAINALEPLALRSSPAPGVWALLAEAYARTGQMPRAAAALTRYLQILPEDVEARATLARVWARLRDWGRAGQAARIARAARPDDVEVALLWIESTLALAAQSEAGTARDLGDVEAELSRLAAAHPERAAVRILQSNLALLRGDAAAAEAALRRAAAECSEPLPAEVELVQFLHRQKRREDALDAARQMVTRHPEHSVPQHLLAELQLAYGDARSAIATLQAAAERLAPGPERSATELKLALIERFSGARSAGLERLREIVARRPDDVRPMEILLSLPETRAEVERAQALVDGIRRIEGDAGLIWRVEQAALWLDAAEWREREEDALQLLSRCTEADPAWNRPVLLLGELHERAGRTEQAEALYRRWLAINGGEAEVADRLLTLLDRARRVADQQELLRSLSLPKSSLYGWRLALALHAQDYEQAADVLRLRIANDASDAAARVLMARLTFHQTGDAAAALAHLDEAESIAGDRTAIIATRVSILEAAGRTDDALRLLTERFERKADLESRWMRGAFYLRLGRIAEAEADYRALPELATDAQGFEILGAFFEQLGRIADAVATWEGGLRRYPDAAEVAGRLARALLMRSAAGDRERAGEIAADLVRRYPADPDVLVLRATCLLLDSASESVEQARGLLERAVRLDPRAADAHLALIQLALSEGAATQARDLSIRALGAAGDDPRLLVARAQAELASRNARLAFELARAVVRRVPRDDGVFDVLRSATLALESEAALNESIAELQRVSAEGRSAARRALALAGLLAAAGRHDEALMVLSEAAVSAGGQAPDVALLLAITEMQARRGQFPEAGETIEQAAAADPASPAVLQARILWLAAQARYGDVAAALSAAPAATREWPQVLYAAGAALAGSPQAEHRRLAVELLDAALNRLPARSAVRLDVAVQMYSAGAVDKAEAVFREALQRDPDNTRALNDLAWLLAEARGTLEAAVALADRGVTLDPDNVDLRDTRGYILSRMGARPAEARADFQFCVNRTRPGSGPRARALLKLAAACVADQDASAAEQCLEEIEAIDRQTGALNADERAELGRLRAALGSAAQ